jgi:ribose transport system permease protein
MSSRSKYIAPETDAAAPPPSRPAMSPAKVVSRYALQIFTAAALVTLAAMLPDFRQWSNLQDVMLQSSFAGLSAAGMTLLIIGGMIDLSVAGIIALTAVTLATLLGVVPLGVALIISLAVGGGLGLINGLMVTKLNFPPFIATYAMMNVYLAAAFIWTHASTLPLNNDTFLALAAGEVFGVPSFFVLLIAGALGCSFLLQRTRFGRDLRAIGSSEPASRMAGLAVDRTRILAFVLFGLLTSAAGLGLASLLSSASANMSIGYELNVIAVAVVGGTTLLGGSGTLFGTVTAAILFSALDNALNLLNVPSYWQYVVAGVVLAVALVAASRRERAEERGRR